ncbi:hypothetical protein [Chromobacterium phragmitis]|uniref:Uncharacterized protein n=1 Tax=Chromobacterium phragmitis TaxID=2202141 RepID=A0ABV0IXK4_9NEIS
MANDDAEEKILKALENPKFKWRTIGGIAKEAKVSPDIVRAVVTQRSERIVKSSVPNTKGEPLFTLREKHRVQTSAFRRLVSALKNRGD